MNFLLAATLLCWKISLLDSVLYKVSDMELVGVLPSAEDEVWSMLLAFIHLLEEVYFMEERCGWVRSEKSWLFLSVDIVKIAFLLLNTGKGKPRVFAV